MAVKGKRDKAEWSSGQIGAAVGGACAALGLGWLAGRLWRRYRDGDEEPAAALKHGKAPGFVGNSGGAKAVAGPGAMRDPPQHWSKVDEAVDESFPASDPPALNPHVD